MHAVPVWKVLYFNTSSLWLCVSLCPCLLKKFFLTLRNIHMASRWLFGAVIPLRRTEALYRPSDPRWFTEICGNSWMRVKLPIWISNLSPFLQHEVERMTFFTTISHTEIPFFLCFLLPFLFGSQVKSHWSTVSKAQVWRESCLDYQSMTRITHLSLVFGLVIQVQGRIYSTETVCRHTTCTFIRPCVQQNGDYADHRVLYKC